MARELKARYRGSVLGFFWSFINPLLLLAIYSFIFTTIMPNRAEGLQPYALFLLCGILPWNWFSTSLNEAAGSLIAGGNLIKKVLFPAEVLPIVSVAREHGALLPRAADCPDRAAALPALAGSGRPRLVSGRRGHPAPVHHGAGPGPGGADGALPRHPRHPDQRADAVVLHHADHLFLRSEGSAAVQVAVQPEPVHAPGHLVPGDPLLQRTVRALEVAARRSAPCRSACSRRLLAVRPAAEIRSPRWYERD